MRDGRVFGRRTEVLTYLALGMLIVVVVLMQLDGLVGSGRHAGGSVLHVVVVGLAFAWMPLGAAVVVSGWLDTRRWPSSMSFRCSGCGYDRRGLAGGAVCPECGRRPRV